MYYSNSSLNLVELINGIVWRRYGPVNDFSNHLLSLSLAMEVRKLIQSMYLMLFGWGNLTGLIVQSWVVPTAEVRDS